MDINPAPRHDGCRALRFVLSPSSTPASVTYASGHPSRGPVGGGEWLEVCPQGLVLAQEIGERVVVGGGAALVADYGSKGGTGNTLRVSL